MDEFLSKMYNEEMSDIITLINTPISSNEEYYENWAAIFNESNTSTTPKTENSDKGCFETINTADVSPVIPIQIPPKNIPILKSLEIKSSRGGVYEPIPNANAVFFSIPYRYKIKMEFQEIKPKSDIKIRLVRDSSLEIVNNSISENGGFLECFKNNIIVLSFRFLVNSWNERCNFKIQVFSDDFGILFNSKEFSLRARKKRYSKIATTRPLTFSNKKDNQKKKKIH